jgi:outer membrane murein-binding lipoprotein Lpp
MFVARTVIAALTSCVLLGLTGCVTTARSNLAHSADRLETNADELAADARDTEYPAGFVRDTHVLSDAAREFRHTVEDSNATDADVRAAFDLLSHDYHAVRDDVEHADSREARVDLRPVTQAYLDIEGEMGGYPVRHASAGY